MSSILAGDPNTKWGQIQKNLADHPILKILGGIVTIITLLGMFYLYVFPIFVPAPLSPSNPQPGDGNKGVALDVDLSWNGGDQWNYPVEYQIYLGKNDKDLRIIKQTEYFKGNGPFGYRYENQLDENTKYYWKVKAINEKGKEKEGPIWKFTTLKYGKPTLPWNPDPSNGSMNIGMVEMLSWNGGDANGYAVTYSIYFGTDEEDLSVLDQTPPLQDSGSCSHALPELAPGKIYYWQIKAINEKHKEIIGPIWKFSTRPIPKIISFSCNRSKLNLGEYSRLDWNVTGAKIVKIEPDIGTVSSKGSRDVSPQTTTEYILNAANDMGEAIPKNVKIWTPPIIRFDCDKEEIELGESPLLEWDVKNADHVELNGEPVAFEGSKRPSITGTTIFNLTSENKMWDSYRRITITVNDDDKVDKDMDANQVSNQRASSETESENSLWVNGLFGIKLYEVTTRVYNPIYLSLHLSEPGHVYLQEQRLGNSYALTHSQGYFLKGDSLDRIKYTITNPLMAGDYKIWCTLDCGFNRHDTNPIIVHVSW